MFNKIQDTLNSREFQTEAGRVVIAVTSIVVSSLVSQLVCKGLNTGLESLMDKIHGTKIETPSE